MAPNPALPKDQPLRGGCPNADVVFTPNSYQSRQPQCGSWRKADAVFTPNSHQSRQLQRGSWPNADAVFAPNSHQSCQSLRGSWLNADGVLLQTRINHANRCAVVSAINVVYDLYLLNSYGFLS